MQLQRWSGLSLVDAVCLSKDELIQDGRTFRVRTQRRKTGAPINNVIPTWLGKELLAAKNDNPTFSFIRCEATTKGHVISLDKRLKQGIPWDHRRDHFAGGGATPAGLEPATSALEARCSAATGTTVMR